MWTQDFDLHSHSTHSDGIHEVEEVAQKMKDSNVKFWALTDHDTISGWNEAREAANKHDIIFIPGVEITCSPGLDADEEELVRMEREGASKSWHLLAYFPSFKDSNEGIEKFESWLKPLQESRLPRMIKMIEQLEELGMSISLEKVLEKAGGSIGRPHLAEVMVEEGYVETKNEAFELWIGDGMPGHYVQQKPSIEEATKIVHSVGGFVSLAHPLYYGVKPEVLIEYCNSKGVDSIEAFHGGHPDSYRFELWKQAQRVQMSITCGSDFHGSNNGHRPGYAVVPFNGLNDELPSSGN
ncbi:MAG: PHP domain-containing protein [Candidatus Poseidoniaceae archaeon]|nr:PHP domain-containing protein [Candidatus Poseidoniaceae archaeon]